MPEGRSHRKLTLVQKLGGGFAVLVILLGTAMTLSCLGLYSLHRTAKEIARKDLVLINSADALRDILQEQDRIVSEFRLKGDPEAIGRFRGFENDFITILKRFLKESPSRELADIASRYERYREQANRYFSGDEAAVVQARKESMVLTTGLYQLEARQHARLDARLRKADRRENSTITLVLAFSLSGLLLAAGVAMLVIRNISRSIDQLKKATHRIAEGDFDYDPRIPEGDEIGDLARELTRMAARLKELEQLSLDASPLTRLPGNIAIERVLNRKLEAGETFALCYADLDDFKAYNDRYGYIQASEIIRLTGQIICETVRELGSPDDFVGHVGGDDFVMVVEQDSVDTLCQAVIDRFDSMIVRHYSPEDLAAGAIKGVDRYGQHRSFPIMTISIVALVCGRDEYGSTTEITRATAEFKNHVKSNPGSNYLVKRRT